MKTNKKVVVNTVTFHRANNYGALLQAYALQKFLINKGFDSSIIDYDNFVISDNSRIIMKNKNNIKKFVIHFIIRMYNLIGEIKRKRNFEKFRSNMNILNYFSDSKKASHFFSKSDVVICGSDQIWNPKITSGLDDVYTLNFNLKKCLKLSYAASCGSVDKIDDINIFLKKIKNIDYISVRENELNELLKKHNIQSKVVIDPTLLLSKKDWMELIGNERIIKDKYIFTYSAGNGNQLYYDVINTIAKKMGLSVVYFDRRCSSIKVTKHNCFFAGPIEFMNLLYNSEFVITTSFHGFALSSILNKKFICVLNSYPERLLTLAKKIGVEDYFIKELPEVDEILNKKINWNDVNKKIINAQHESGSWLLNSIKEGIKSNEK